MTTLTSLPDELLRKVLEEHWLCLDSSYRARELTLRPSDRHPTWGFFRCMLLLCRRTHNIALPMLYCHVVAIPSVVGGRFLENVSNSPAIPALIQG